MLLSEVFYQLTYGELVQINLGGASEAGITKENYHRMLAHVNMGLTELHKRFLIKEGTLKIARQVGLDTYVLSKKYAIGNRESQEPVKYIQDSVAQPFLDTVLKVERVYGLDGLELELNTGGDRYDPLSQVIRSPSFNTLIVPSAVEGSELTVVYRANHPIIVREDNSFDPTEVDIDLPYSYMEPLLLYIASRVFNPIGLNQQFHDGNNYAAKFEASCLMIQNQGLQNEAGEVVDRNSRNGWV